MTITDLTDSSNTAAVIDHADIFSTGPEILLGPAIGTTQSQAQLVALLQSGGLATTYYFQYGRSTSYGNRTTQTTLPAGAPVTVAADVGALRPYTLYHWRLFARNAAGNTPGRDHTFRTGRLATALTLFSAKAKVQYGRGVTLGGRVSGAGINQMTLDDIIASRGGFPLIRGGKLIGAIGCSGGASSQDALVCAVGAALVK